MTEHRFKVLKVIVQKDVTEQEYPFPEHYYRVKYKKYYVKDRYTDKTYVLIKTNTWEDPILCTVEPTEEEIEVDEPELRDKILGFILDWEEERYNAGGKT
jgi:hypothetical protein